MMMVQLAVDYYDGSIDLGKWSNEPFLRHVKHHVLTLIFIKRQIVDFRPFIDIRELYIELGSSVKIT